MVYGECWSLVSSYPIHCWIFMSHIYCVSFLRLTTAAVSYECNSHFTFRRLFQSIPPHPQALTYFTLPLSWCRLSLGDVDINVSCGLNSVFSKSLHQHYLLCLEIIPVFQHALVASIFFSTS